MAAKEHNIAEIENGAENLLEKYEQTGKLLRDVLHLGVPEAAQAEEKTEISAQELREKLSEAKKCIENFEAESALEILKPLAARSFADAAVWDELRKTMDALESFDTFTAVEGIKVMMERVQS
jgi:predicted ribosome quality control (RQC) complex YloA/Tae2 family protein